MNSLRRYLESKLLRSLPLLLLLAITIFSALFNYWNIQGHASAMARHYAEGIFRLIVDARAWNANHGGVYANVDGDTQPNPYLETPERDLFTVDGRHLTMINPSYMTRQIGEITNRRDDLQTYITSRQPINPANEPDPWERAALESFASQQEDYRLELLGQGTEQQFRYMAPLWIAESCLPCHAPYGYELGELRGGISISFPAAPYFAMLQPQKNLMLLLHLVGFMAVASLLVMLLNRLRRHWREMEQVLAEQEEIIGQRTAKLARESERYHTIIDTAAEGYWELDANQQTVMVNKALCQMLGYTQEEMLGRTPLDFVDGNNAQIFREQLGQRESNRNRAYNITLQTRAGRELHARFHATSLLTKDGKLLGSFAFITDITELLQVRESVVAYALKLERSNKELQDFAHIASHDLQEPLRTIVSFGDRLLLKHADQLDDRGREYLERIQGATIRMRQLIEDLLNYSRVTSRDQHLVELDLDDLLAEVLEDLSQRLHDCGGRVESVGSLGKMVADRGQLRRLLLNLIGNALKFQAAGDTPLVRVSRRELADQRLEIVIEDNGIGFDEKYLDRIFRPFQRLHGREQYQGTGMGLAICKKIVERHHGELLASSTPGQGTTFRIILPA